MSKTASRKANSRKHFCWFKFMGLVLAILLLAKMGQQYQRYQIIRAEAAEYQQRLEIAQKAYKDLQKQKELLSNDSYLEQMARSSLGMVKMGEVVISPAEISDVPETNEGINEKDVFH